MNNALPQAILFDMDDTLLTDSVNGDQCWQICFERLAQRVAPLSAATAIAAIKEYARWYWGDAERHRQGRLDMLAARRAIVAEALLRLGIDQRELAHEVADTFSLLRDEAIVFCGGAHDLLCHLKERGVRLALLTNGNAAMQRRKIERFGLDTFFDCVLIEGEFGVGKPDERVYRHALDRLGTRPVETWMVGDNLEWDVAAPQRLGIIGIWVDVAGEGVPASSAVRPDRTIRTLPELLAG
jgi:putative hydrolase of the HAD superfamily